MSEFIITFRETLEAALIVGIIATFLVKQGYIHTLKQVWRAILAAIVASGGFARALGEIQHIVGSTAYEKLFEALMMFITAGILLYMVVWMTKGNYRIYSLPTQTTTNNPHCLGCELNHQSQQLKPHTSRSIKQTIVSATQQTLGTKAKWGIFSLVFFAIAREGFETALFLFSSHNLTETFSFFGFFGGIVIASILGYLLFVSGKRIKLQSFFTVSSLLLVVFAAGMATYGTHEMEEFLVEQGYIENIHITRVWDIVPPQTTLLRTQNPKRWTYNTSKDKRYHILHDKGSIGVFLKGFLGYNSNPNRIEPFVWLFVLLLGFGLIIPIQQKR